MVFPITSDHGSETDTGDHENEEMSQCVINLIILTRVTSRLSNVISAAPCLCCIIAYSSKIRSQTAVNSNHTGQLRHKIINTIFRFCLTGLFRRLHRVRQGHEKISRGERMKIVSVSVRVTTECRLFTYKLYGINRWRRYRQKIRWYR